MKKFVAAIVLCVTFSAPAWAGTETITLSVSRMTCTAWEALVTYDDAKTGVEALTKATEGAG